MAFRFSPRSKINLYSVDHQLFYLAVYALATSEIDFTVTDGIRTVKEQAELFRKGRKYINGSWVEIPGEQQVTWTMNSKHLTGKAIDIYPYPIPDLRRPSPGYREKQLILRKHFLKCADILGIPIRVVKKDLPHIELK